jgi:hypothetical protein
MAFEYGIERGAIANIDVLKYIRWIAPKRINGLLNGRVGELIDIDDKRALLVDELSAYGGAYKPSPAGH